MVSAELLKPYPFFAGLSQQQLATVTQAAQELTAEAGHIFFREGDELDHFYVVVEGEVAIIIALPDNDVAHSLASQIDRSLLTRDVAVTTAGPGDVFGWSGLIPPYECSAGAKAVTDCTVVAVDCAQLRPAFVDDGHFGYVLTERAAQLIRERLRALRNETLSHLAA